MTINSSYESENPSNYTNEDIVKFLIPIFAKISKNEVKLIYHGSYNVYEIDNDKIFRFPDKSMINYIFNLYNISNKYYSI